MYIATSVNILTKKPTGKVLGANQMHADSADAQANLRICHSHTTLIRLSYNVAEL